MGKRRVPGKPEPTLHILEEHAQRIGRNIADSLPKGVGFCLLVFDFGPPGGFMTYTSNANRGDMINALRECADNLEASSNA